MNNFISILLIVISFYLVVISFNTITINMTDVFTNEGFIYDYQTLISGLLALGGALGTIVYLKKQLSFEKKKHSDQKEIDKFFYKAQLSNALRELLDFLHEIFISFEKKEYIIPPEPLKALEIFYLNLKHADLETAKNLKKIADDYQQCMSRVRKLKEDDEIGVSAYGIFYLSLLTHLFSSLLSYAKVEDKVTKIEPSKEDLIDGFKKLVGSKKFHNKSSYKYIDLFEDIEKLRVEKIRIDKIIYES